jgi:alanine-synthesizing transaminase
MFSARTGWSLAANELTKLCEKRKQSALPILDLTESNPTRCGFKYGENKVLDAFRDPRILRYEPNPRGLDLARQAVLEYYREHGVEFAAEQIFLTATTSEAYSFIFRLLADPGDRLLAPQPSYPLFEFLTRLNDLELAHYALVEQDSWRIDRNLLERQISDRTRAILVVHPNNPTGSFVHNSDRDFMVDRGAARHLALIADEVFHDYSMSESKEPQSFASENRILTFTLSGLSKISALPQMKCAWIVLSGPDSLVKEASARLEVIADTYLSMSTPAALALPCLLALRRELQPQIMARIQLNLTCLDRSIGRDSPINRLIVEGGWYAVLRLPAWQSDEAWAIQLLEHDGVLIHPGHFYDFRDEGRAVVSLICLPEIFEEGIKKLVGRIGNDECVARR